MPKEFTSKSLQSFQKETKFVISNQKRAGKIGKLFKGKKMFKEILEVIKQILFLTSVCIIIEFWEFSSLGLRYPYPDEVPFWLIRNTFLGIFLFWFWFRERTKTKHQMSPTSLPIFFISIFITFAIHLSYPGEIFCGLSCIGLYKILVPGIFLLCLAATTFALFLSQRLNETNLNHGLLLVIIPLYLLIKPMHLSYLEKKYPAPWLQGEFNYYFEDAKRLSSTMTEFEWVDLCEKFDFLSLRSHLFGALHSAKCYTWGAVFYNKPELCDRFENHQKESLYNIGPTPPKFPLKKKCLKLVQDRYVLVSPS